MLQKAIEVKVRWMLNLFDVATVYNHMFLFRL